MFYISRYVISRLIFFLLTLEANFWTKWRETKQTSKVSASAWNHHLQKIVEHLRFRPDFLQATGDFLHKQLHEHEKMKTSVWSRVMSEKDDQGSEESVLKEAVQKGWKGGTSGAAAMSVQVRCEEGSWVLLAPGQRDMGAAFPQRQGLGDGVLYY